MKEEIIVAQAFFPPRQINLLVRSKEIFCFDRHWSTEDKFTLLVSPEKRLSTVMAFVQKDSTHSADEILGIWHKLKKLGLPVVPTMRKIDDYSVIMTNLTFDGSFLFGKYIRYAKDASVPKSMVKKFKNIPILPIKQRAWILADICNNNDIELAYDDAFEILVHPNGSWELIMLDLSGVVVDIKPEDKDSLEENNSKHCDLFFETIITLKDKLK